jgi:hypothetical protein
MRRRKESFERNMLEKILQDQEDSPYRSPVRIVCDEDPDLSDGGTEADPLAITSPPLPREPDVVTDRSRARLASVSN